MKVELLNITDNAENLIELAGRTCYNSAMGDNTIIKRWIQAGHESTLEHATATFRVSCVSRSLLAQITRHRHLSFCVQSQRYVNQDLNGYVVPERIAEDPDLSIEFDNIVEEVKNFYDNLVKSGIKKEDARFILPEGSETKFVVTGNFRAWRDFFKLRLAKNAQWEIREMAEKMLDYLYTIAPNCFYDFE